MRVDDELTMLVARVAKDTKAISKILDQRHGPVPNLKRFFVVVTDTMHHADMTPQNPSLIKCESLYSMIRGSYKPV